MNTRQLEYIIAVSDTLSFSEAAKKLFVSQPSLSQYVKKVEEEIGNEIFVRTTPLKLTYQGEIFVRYAKKVLEEELQFKAAMKDISDNEAGVITIGAGPLNSEIVLPEIIASFTELYPNIEVNVLEYAESDLIEALDKGEIDLLLTVMSPQIQDNYIIEEVMREQYVLAIPQRLDPKASTYLRENYKDSVGSFPIINIKECKNLPYIMQTSMMPAHGIFVNLCRREGFLPKSKITCKNINTAINLAKRGTGACFIPSSVTTAISDELNFYKVEGNEANRVIKIISRKSMKASIVQETFVSLIRKYYGQL